MPPGVVDSPVGAGVPPLVCVGAVDVVVCEVVVGDAVVVVLVSIGTVSLALSLSSSPMTMIRPTARPITRAMRIPIVQRAREFTGAMLTEAEDQAVRSFR